MKRYGLIFTLALLAGCSGPLTYAEREQFRADSRFSRNFSAAPEPVCEAARRALLRDGYIIENGAEPRLEGVKEFQIEKGRHAILRVYGTCGQRADGSILFVTATEEHFDVLTSRQSTSVGVPLVSPISISKNSEVDNQVKTLGETVADKKFYERFYRAVQQELVR